MRDEMDARIWAAHHEDFSQGVDKALKHIWIAFCRLNRRQFDAPWRPRSSDFC